ncbi:MAG: hypothetical protein Q8P73_00915 [bacterium]|nr:hypothetical protein [bacterium]
MFTKWLKNELTRLYSVKGYIHEGKGAYTIRYVKGDTRKLYRVMYSDAKDLYLARKHDKIKQALDFDWQLHHSKPQATVAQW